MKKNLLQYVLCSACGFGLGGALWGYIISLFWGKMGIMDNLVGGLLFGVVGGLFLSVLQKENKLRLIICSAIGYAITGLFLFHSSVTIFLIFLPCTIAIYGFRIFISGLLLGLALKRIKLFLFLGALGNLGGCLFVVFLKATCQAFGKSAPGDIVIFTVAGLGIGLFLGIGMYLADKKEENRT